MFTAGFIGTPQINFFPVVIEGGDAGLTAKAGGFQMALPADTFKVNAGERVILGIRPSHIDIVEKGAPDAIAARVEMLENMGEETLVSFSVGKDAGVFLALSEKAPKRGDDIFIRFNRDKLHVFVQDSSVSLRRK